MQPQQETVFVIDDDISICRGLFRQLDAAGFQVETYSSAADYLERQDYTGIGCIILDISMPGMNGLELQKKLEERHNGLPIIFLTAHGDLSTGIQAMKAGAEDFLCKPVDEKLLFEAVNQSLEKHRELCQKKRLRNNYKACLESLTHREMEVLRYILGGSINRQTGQALSISEKTVKAHRAKIMKKMSVSSAAELGALCAKLDITPITMASNRRS